MLAIVRELRVRCWCGCCIKRPCLVTIPNHTTIRGQAVTQGRPHSSRCSARTASLTPQAQSCTPPCVAAPKPSRGRRTPGPPPALQVARARARRRRPERAPAPGPSPPCRPASRARPDIRKSPRSARPPARTRPAAGCRPRCYALGRLALRITREAPVYVDPVSKPETAAHVHR